MVGEAAGTHKSLAAFVASEGSLILVQQLVIPQALFCREVFGALATDKLGLARAPPAD